MNDYSLVSAVIGGLLTGVFALVGVILSSQLAKKRDELAHKKRVLNFREALLAEVKTYYSIYNKNIGNQLRKTPDDSCFDWYYPVTQDRYFTIYESGAPLLGYIKSDEERELIVEVYAKTRAVIDAYRFNNLMLDRMHELETSTNIDNKEEKIDSLDRIMKEYTNTIKSLDSELVGYAENLIVMLRSKKDYTKEYAIPTHCTK